MKVVDASTISMKMINESKGRPLSVTGTSNGGYILVTGGTFITRMKLDRPTDLKKGNKITICPDTLVVNKVG